jgi:hypothetical protein
MLEDHISLPCNDMNKIDVEKKQIQQMQKQIGRRGGGG